MDKEHISGKTRDGPAVRSNRRKCVMRPAYYLQNRLSESIPELEKNRLSECISELEENPSKQRK